MAADGTIQIDVNLNAQNAQNGLNGLNQQSQNLGGSSARSVEKLAATFYLVSTAAKAAYGFVKGVADSVFQVGSALVQAAGSAQALNSQFSQVFGDLEANATESLTSIARETSILPERLKGSFVQIAAFAKTAGSDTQTSLDIASRATLAAADSAAFYDKSIQDVTESLQSYLKGKEVAPL